MYKTYSMELAGKTLTVDIGRVCAQANAAALIIGLIAIYFALHILSKPKSLQAFGYYRIILSLIVLIVALLVI